MITWLPSPYPPTRRPTHRRSSTSRSRAGVLGTPDAYYHPCNEYSGMGEVSLPPPPVRLGWDVQKVDGGIDVRFDEVDVRAGEGETLPPVYLIVTGHAGDAVSMNWTFTSADSLGVEQGDCDLVVTESSFDILGACNIDNV